MFKRFFIHGHPLAVSATVALIAMLAYQILPPIMSGNFLGQVGNGGGQCPEYGKFTSYFPPGLPNSFIIGAPVSDPQGRIWYSNTFSVKNAGTITTQGVPAGAETVPLSYFGHDSAGKSYLVPATNPVPPAQRADGTPVSVMINNGAEFVMDAAGNMYTSRLEQVRLNNGSGMESTTLYVDKTSPGGVTRVVYRGSIPGNEDLSAKIAIDVDGNILIAYSSYFFYSVLGPLNNQRIPISSIKIAQLAAGTGRVQQEFSASFPGDTESYLNEIAFGPQGTVWITAGARNENIYGRTQVDLRTYLIKITPSTQQSSFFDLGLRTGISDMVVAPDGNVWAFRSDVGVDGTRLVKIAMDGSFTDYGHPAGHYIGGSLIVGPDGNLWMQGIDKSGALHHGEILKFSLCGTGGGTGGNSSSSASCIGPATVTRHIVASAPREFGQVVPVAVGSDGNIWFTKEMAGKISKLSVPGDVVTDYGIPWGNPVNRPLVKGSDGNLWFTSVDPFGASTSKIGRVTPTGSIMQFDTPAFANGPITLGPDGNIWFSEIAMGMAKIAKITPAGVITEYPTSLFGRIQGFAKGSDGNIWFTPSGNGAGWIGKMTTAGVVTQYTLPASVSTTDSIITNTMVSGPDGNIWFTVSNITGNKIGKITPAGDVTLTDSPFAGFLVIGPDAAVWTVWGTNIGRVASDGSVTQFSMPATMGNVVAPESFVSGPSQSFWLGGKEILSFGICALGAPVVQSGGSSQAGGGQGSSASGRGSCVVQTPVSNSAISKTCSPRTSVGVACDPPQVYQITTSEQSTLELTYTAAAGHCTPVRVHVRVDGGPEVVSSYVNANEVSVLGLGSFPAGNHAVEVRGSASQDCGGGSQPLATWGGTATIRVIPIQCSSSSARSTSSGLRAGPTQSSSQPSVNRNGTGPVCPPCRQACGVSGPSCITCGAGTVPTCPAGSIGAPYCDINNKPRCMFAGGGVTSATCGAATQAPPLSCAQCTATYCGSSDVCVVGSSSSRAGGSSSSMSSSSLRSGPGCGDGIVQPPEECDAGTGGSATCDTGCRTIACGDNSECPTGLCLNGACRCDADNPCPQGEQCDSGTGQCVVPRCGDGLKEISEACDDGNMADNDGCSFQCQIECDSGDQCDSGICQEGVCQPVCGDGIKETTESCDDGNVQDGDGCSIQCQIECDSGNQCDSGICQAGVCAPVCGDGIKEAAEICDDGNTQSGDGCNALCLLECTDNSACPTGLCINDVCSPTSCGNGVTDVGEACDDGNGTDDDACNSVCLLGMYQDCVLRDQCGSNLCQQGQCSPCNTTADCGAGLLCLGRMCASAPACGNGKHEFGETCDDGDLDDGDVCSNTCQNGIGLACEADRDCVSERCVSGTCTACARADQCASNECTNGRCAPACGNGEIDRGEQCDAGAQNSDVLSDQCRKNCLRPQCGDGVQDAGEQCDDGNADDTDGCTRACRAVQVQSIMGSGGSGSPCADSTQCASGACQNGACKGMPAGTSCITGAQCVSGSCDSGACSPTDAQVANLTGGHAPAGETGPAAIAVMGAGAAAGWAWMRRKGYKGFRR